MLIDILFFSVWIRELWFSYSSFGCPIFIVCKVCIISSEGDRSFSPYTNSGNYGGIPTSEIVSSSNTSKTFVFIVESLKGIDELPSILKVFPEFADVIYIGAYDLSADMGFHGQPRHPNVVQKIQEALKLCLSHSVSVGAYVPKVLGVEELLDLGFTFILYNVDSSLLLVIIAISQSLLSFAHETVIVIPSRWRLQDSLSKP